jgi:hypothetical protein
MKRLLAAVALAMVSCSPPAEYVFYWPDDNPPEDLPKLETAVAHWNACGAVQISISNKYGVPVSFQPGDFITGRPGYAGFSESTNVNCLGCIGSGTHILYVHRQGYPSDDIDRTTLEHEVGHVLGLHHFGVLNQELMYSEAGWATQVGREDCRQLREIHGYADY